MFSLLYAIQDSSPGSSAWLIWVVVIIIVYGLECGGACWYLAKEKNRDTTNFFIAGFFLGIIGVIVAAAVPQLAKTPLEKLKRPAGLLDNIDYYIHLSESGEVLPYYVGGSIGIEIPKLVRTNSPSAPHFGTTADGRFLITQGEKIVFQTMLSIIELSQIRGSDFLENRKSSGFHVSPAEHVLYIVVNDQEKGRGEMFFGYGSGESSLNSLKADMASIEEKRSGIPRP